MHVAGSAILFGSICGAKKKQQLSSLIHLRVQISTRSCSNLIPSLRCSQDSRWPVQLWRQDSADASVSPVPKVDLLVTPTSATCWHEELMDRFSPRSRVILWNGTRRKERRRWTNYVGGGIRSGPSKCPPLSSLHLSPYYHHKLCVTVYFLCKCVAVGAVSGTLGWSVNPECIKVTWQMSLLLSKNWFGERARDEGQSLLLIEEFNIVMSVAGWWGTWFLLWLIWFDPVCLKQKYTSS